MLIVNAKIYTMENKIIENGFIYVSNGLIRKVDEMKNLNFCDSETIDLQGNSIYPGFIDAHTHLGIFEDSLSFEGDDTNEESDPITPHLRAIDAVNPMDRGFKDALKAGITTVVTGPGSANPIAGQLIAMKTYGNRIDDMIIKSPVAMKFSLGENPKTVYRDKEQSPVTRMATTAIIREQLHKAKRYFENKRKAEISNGDYDLPEYDAKCEALIPVLNKSIQAHFHVHRADDIFTAIRISKEFNLDLVIVHGTEGHIITDYLRTENVPVLSGPFLTGRTKPELKNLSSKTPGILSSNNIKTAIITDHPETPIELLTVCAAVAVREGMSKEDALKAITINAAKACRIDDEVGSIKVGKDADFVVFSSNPLDAFSKPSMVICKGRRIGI